MQVHTITDTHGNVTGVTVRLEALQARRIGDFDDTELAVLAGKVRLALQAADADPDPEFDFEAGHI